jgi:hypothetical protein
MNSSRGTDRQREEVSLMRYTVTDIIKELEAELAVRRRAFAKWVASGKLTEDNARRKIELIEDAVKLLRGIADEHSQHEALDALLDQRVREADAQGKARIITSREILEHTGIPPRRLGLMMQERGWQRVWVAHGVRGWLLPTPAESINTNANTVDNSNGNTVAVETINTNANTVDNSNGNTVAVETINTNANTVDNSNANTVAVETINTNANTVDNSNANTVALRECDHRLMALADLTQMDDLSYAALARQMLERTKEIRLCGRCALVAGAIQTSQLDTPSRARQRIADALSRAARQPAPPVAAEPDPMLLIDEEYRALAQFVTEHLAAHRSETFMRLCDALEKRVGRGKANQAAYMLARLAEQPGFQRLVKIERKDGDHLLKSVWSLRSEPSLFST